ncbi:unnamed protein product [Eruca vesicaria subsp. sativa]|uniref:Peptidase C1A papain C-terminal domain-containing protein n=1 Tax=Eruca vesicaria subsp. sativa TaxID=29727 RepID=A0ABC8L765_ERUVS|nr:unnamed protein product [Eruca vesicaria subsp. sativa]
MIVSRLSAAKKLHMLGGESIRFSEGYKLEKKYMGLMRDQGGHDTCWAVVTAELISAIRFILKYDTKYTEYSAQYLVDYADPAKASVNYAKKRHYCYTYSVAKGLDFVLDGGIPTEAHWKYEGCRKPPAYRLPKDQAHVHIASVQRFPSVDEMLYHLQFHPIGASLALFLPDYSTVRKGIYRGPTSNESVFKALHAVSIYGIEVVNGETIALVKSTHGEELGDGGYFRVSLDTMIVEVPCKGKTAHRDLAQPCRLLSRFCFPKLPPRQV